MFEITNEIFCYDPGQGLGGCQEEHVMCSTSRLLPSGGEQSECYDLDQGLDECQKEHVMCSTSRLLSSDDEQNEQLISQ